MSKYIGRSLKHISLMKSLGAHYGYPRCCTWHFIKHRILADHTKSESEVTRTGKWSYSGFVPCPECSDKISATSFRDFIDKRILPHRTEPAALMMLTDTSIKKIREIEDAEAAFIKRRHELSKLHNAVGGCSLGVHQGIEDYNRDMTEHNALSKKIHEETEYE